MKKGIRRVLSIMFVLFLGVSFVSPSANVYAASTPKVKTYTKKYSGKKKSELICEGKFQGLKMSGKSKLAKSVNSYSNKQWKYFKSEWKLIKKYAISDGVASRSMPYSLYSTLTAKTNNKKYVSIACVDSEYLGGAHPSHQAVFVTFNKKNGKKVSLKNVANCSIKQFNQKVVNRLSRKISSDYKAMFNESYKSDLLKYKFSNYNFYYDKNKLHIYFNQYEVGPYSMGPVDIVIN